MGVMAAEHSSTLNPYAPLFVPMSYRVVEDYSAEWWELVRSSPCFRDYWLRECFSEEAPDLDAFESLILPEADECDEEEVDGKGGQKEIVAVRAMKGKKPRGGAVEPRRYMEKVPKIVSVKVSPRPIQQPR